MSDFNKWKREVLGRVRFFPDRSAIEKELTAHFQDGVADLMRLGYPQALAEERTVQFLGDAEEVGTALDRAHRPLAGWVWLLSTLLAASGIFYLVLGAFVGSFSSIEADLSNFQAERKSAAYSTQAKEYIPCPEGSTLTAVATASVPDFTRADYEFSIPYATLWEVRYPDGFTCYTVTTLLRCQTEFWEREPYYALRAVEGTDSLGNVYACWDEYYSNGKYMHENLTVEERRERWDGVVNLHYGETYTPFARELWFTHRWMEQRPEWTELHCTSGEGFTVRLDWGAAT